ncbi:MAG: hypothetical protein MH252_14235 [Thermosynechococcaceae cyanobacterium MS004]|nr:hypothetical protein [Thermosynechococcaceae cyanobacterium MS004]
MKPSTSLEDLDSTTIPNHSDHPLILERAIATLSGSEVWRSLLCSLVDRSLSANAQQ